MNILTALYFLEICNAQQASMTGVRRLSDALNWSDFYLTLLLTHMCTAHMHTCAVVQLCSELECSALVSATGRQKGRSLTPQFLTPVIPLVKRGLKIQIY